MKFPSEKNKLKESFESVEQSLIDASFLLPNFKLIHIPSITLQVPKPIYDTGWVQVVLDGGGLGG